MNDYNKEILIVDDEDSICQSLKEFIATNYGYKADTAEDGLIALEKITQESGKYGIVLTDLKMPRMNGLELIHNVKKIRDDLIFIIITGYATKDNAISALKEGAYDFVHKPFNIDEMRAVLNRALDYWLLKEENRNYQQNLEKLVKERTSELQTLNADLHSLLTLEESINKMKELERRIDIFQAELFKQFNPETSVMMVYDNFSNAFSSPWIYTKDLATVELPENENLLRTGKRFFCEDTNEVNFDRTIWLNKQDGKFAFARLEHQVFLGYLYLGFGKQIVLSKYQNQINLFITSLESVLYNNYLVKKHERELEKMFLSGIKVIADTVEATSPFTRKHSDRVEKVAKILAEKLGFPYERKYLLSIACILHDIGKVGIDNRIVNKPGILNEEEIAQIRQHSALGANIVKNLYGFKIDQIIRHHHERWDGCGYPDGLKGEKIPMESRIIALSDAFDSMVSNRPYRKGLPLNKVTEEIKANAGTQFDPQLAQNFLECINENMSTFKLMILTDNE